VKAWTDRVHYEGEVVAHRGSLWQATKDTGQTAGGPDWLCLATRGLDAKLPRVRGTWSELVADYETLDIVVLNGGSFIAKHDKPGVCPGEGWQLIAKQGKPGATGERGPRGEPGPAGAAAPIIKSWKIDRANYVAVPIMSDGREGVPLHLRGLFEAYHSASS
jgi:hypothetical protein